MNPRNLLAPLYGILVVVGFIIGPGVGVIVVVVGAMVIGLAYGALNRSGPALRDRDRSERRARRAERRGGG